MKKKILSLALLYLLVFLSGTVFAAVDYSTKMMENDYRQFMSRTNSQLQNFRTSTLQNDQRDRNRQMKEFKEHYDRMIKDAKQKLRDFREYVSLKVSSLENTRIRQRDTQDMIKRNRVVLQDKTRMQKDLLRNNKEKLQELRSKVKDQNRR